MKDFNKLMILVEVNRFVSLRFKMSFLIKDVQVNGKNKLYSLNFIAQKK